MSDSKKSTAKCFSFILRRLLCTGSLPTHPSDQIAEHIPIELLSDKHSLLEAELKNGDNSNNCKVEAPASPGIVARLMGLDSLPDIRWDPKGNSPDSLGRSRSMNSLEYLLQFERVNSSSRRFRTSVSFREIPTFLHNEQNRDFFVLRLEKNAGENAEVVSKQRKSEMGSVELKQRKAGRGKKGVSIREKMTAMENEDNRKKKVCKVGAKGLSSKPFCSKAGNCHGDKGLRINGFPPPNKDVLRKQGAIPKAKHPPKPACQNELSVKSKFEKKKKAERLGPVFVLDLHDVSTPSHECSSPEASRRMRSNLKKKSSPKVAKSDYPSPNLIRTSNIDLAHEQRSPKNRGNEQPKNNYEQSLDTLYCAELLSKICWLTEEDLINSEWVAKEMNRYEELEDTCKEFGQQILQQLLHEAVDELLELPPMENLLSNS
ncbi:uncharacterized protein LOC131168697 [Malania oleifera]|uniref:uncharacterized protein LOC131168697 n=1 Tax=Malania oleifera TaxID=397392 RepID=UPI0025AE2404|nr:uncharacterized protein LOC131168697 [Malania oleifera]